MKIEAFLRTQANFFCTKYFLRTGNPRYLREKQNTSFSQNLPNMGKESGTVLRLRLMRKLAMSHTLSVTICFLSLFLFSFNNKKMLHTGDTESLGRCG